ncbi:hypothetical protein [Microvirga sp. M2]|uniref:hypothetical protein n=1 Tax=Microvirga sp. M2 TaxID=3073270 RepID=UPI0039C169CA
MTSEHDPASQALHDPDLIEEVQFLDHRIRFGPTRSAWVSFVARQGQRPTIVLATDRATLMAEARRLIRRRVEEGR